MDNSDNQARELILHLKQVKATRGLSCGRIHAMVEEAGGAVSLSTVKRVFSDGSEDWNFRICDTVQPIADVLLAPESETEMRGSERAAYRAMAEQQSAMLGNVSALLEGRSADALSLARDQLDQYERRLRSAERRVVLLVAVLVLLLTLIIVALFVDRLNPDLDFFWLAEQAAHRGSVDTAVHASLCAPRLTRCVFAAPSAFPLHFRSAAA